MSSSGGDEGQGSLRIAACGYIIIVIFIVNQYYYLHYLFIIFYLFYFYSFNLLFFLSMVGSAYF